MSHFMKQNPDGSEVRTELGRALSHRVRASLDEWLREFSVLEGVTRHDVAAFAMTEIPHILVDISVEVAEEHRAAKDDERAPATRSALQSAPSLSDLTCANFPTRDGAKQALSCVPREGIISLCRMAYVSVEGSKSDMINRLVEVTVGAELNSKAIAGGAA